MACLLEYKTQQWFHQYIKGALSVLRPSKLFSWETKAGSVIAEHKEKVSVLDFKYSAKHKTEFSTLEGSHTVLWGRKDTLIRRNAENLHERLHLSLCSITNVLLNDSVVLVKHSTKAWLDTFLGSLPGKFSRGHAVRVARWLLILASPEFVSLEFYFPVCSR